MSTRSRIGMVQDDGTILSIYCHSDGYLDAPHGVGHKLHTLFQRPTLINELLQLGGRATITNGESPFGRVYDNVHTVVDEDKDETGFRARAEEFNYLFENGKWWVWQTWGTDFQKSKNELPIAITTARLIEGMEQ